jgi:RNA polymerase sigma-70 factor, ECF subfamily
MTRGDTRLLKRAARGDERALERLYEDHVDALYTFVFYRVGRDPALAEDVVQETFTRALDGADRFDAERGNLRSWLVTMSRNAARDLLRAQRRLTVVEAWDRIDESLAIAFDSIDAEPLSDEVISRAETRDMVAMTIANLPHPYGEALERKYVGGETLSELGARLGLSEDGAKSLLARARRAFRDAFATLSRAMAEGTEAVAGSSTEQGR